MWVSVLPRPRCVKREAASGVAGCASARLSDMSAAARPLPAFEQHPAPAVAVDSGTSRRDREWIALTIAVALTLAAALVAIDPLPVGVFYDDAQYVILAKALASGDGYRFLNLPGAPAATHFPPGYPLLLALLWKLSPSFPENVALFKLANALLLAVVAAGTFRFARRTLGAPNEVALVATLAGTVAIPTLVLSSSVMSEPLFLAVLLPLLSWVERASTVGSPHGKQPALRVAALIGAVIAVVTLIRSHGIVLVGAAASIYFLRGRRREAIVCAVAAIVPLVPWFLWMQRYDAALSPLVRGAYGSYGGWLVAGLRSEGIHLLAATIPDNVATVVWSIARSLVPGNHQVLQAIAALAFGALSIVAIPTMWRRARAMLLFVALYLAVVIVWPFSPLRFVWGIWPLVMLFPAVGAWALWQSAPARSWPPKRIASVAASGIVVAGLVWFTVVGYANAWWGANARFHARRIVDQLAWVGAKTQPADIVASDAEGAVYLYTGRRAVPLASFTATEYLHDPSLGERTRMMTALIDHYHPRYVMVSSPLLAEAAARLAASSTLVRVDTIARGVVYRNLRSR